MVGMAPGAWARASFGEVKPVGTLAVADNLTANPTTIGDDVVAVAGGPNGTVIATWGSADSAVSVNLRADVLVSRSADYGRTWSPSVSVYSSPESYDAVYSDVATDGAGLWIAAVIRSRRVVVVRSTDDGQTWEAPIEVPPGLSTDSAPLTIASGANGTWITIWGSEYPSAGGDKDLYFSRSTDSGQTWSTPAPLVVADEGVNDGRDEHNPRVETDGAGTWIAVWDHNSTPVASRSVDDGLTWASPISLGTAAGLGYFSAPDVVYDGAHGTWVAVFEPALFRSLQSVRSTDGGQTWSSQASVLMPDQNYLEVGSDARVVASGGRLTVAFGVGGFGGGMGKDSDLMSADSYDGGLTWDAPAMLNVTGRRDSGFDWRLALTTVGDHDLFAAWSSSYDLDGTIGTDFDILGAGSHDDCPALPKPGCISGTSAGAFRLMIKDGPLGNDRLSWTWKRGGETTTGDLGSPQDSSSYAFCVYAKAGGSTVAVMEEDIPAGQTCMGLPCWSGDPSRPRYRDSENRHGPVKVVGLAAGASGQASIQLRASGVMVGPPLLPLDLSTPVTAQLLNTETGACWEATYSTGWTNTTQAFKGQSD